MARRNTCRCVTCSKFGNSRTFGFSWHEDGWHKEYTCGLCEIEVAQSGRKHGATWMADQVPTEIKEFLGFDDICCGHMNTIAARATEIGLCWGYASVKAIQVVLLIVLNDILNSEAYAETYHQAQMTRCLNKGEFEYAEVHKQHLIKLQRRRYGSRTNR